MARPYPPARAATRIAAATPQMGHHGATPSHGATAPRTPAARSPAAARRSPALHGPGDPTASVQRPRRARRWTSATAPTQTSVASTEGTKRCAMNSPGPRPRRSITIRLAGFPWGSASENALATPMVPSSSGRSSSGAARVSVSSTGTISTTAPSSETVAVRRAQRVHTRRYSNARECPARRATASARRRARPVLSANALSQIAAVRNRASGAAAWRATPRRPGGATPASTSTAAHAVAKIAAAQPRGCRITQARAVTTSSVWRRTTMVDS